MGKEWNQIQPLPNVPAPLGRYGHAVTMIGTKFFVFGGHADGRAQNDLWSFDLTSSMFLVYFSCNRRFNVRIVLTKSKRTVEAHAGTFGSLPLLIDQPLEWVTCV